MDNPESDFPVSEKFKKFEDQGISAPQVLTFLDNISTMLRTVSTDIDRAVNNIQIHPQEEMETKEEQEETSAT